MKRVKFLEKTFLGVATIIAIGPVIVKSIQKPEAGILKYNGLNVAPRELTYTMWLGDPPLVIFAEDGKTLSADDPFLKMWKEYGGQFKA